MPARLPLLVLAVALAGCGGKPTAPPLVNEAVYQNDAAGVRFLAPDGWQMSSRAELPPVLPKPIVLVAYLNTQGDRVAEFELVVADLPPEADAGKFLNEYRIGADKWLVAGPPAAVEVNGAAAQRYTLLRTKKKSKDEYQREVTVFRRGGRVYCFAVTFWTDDPAHRDAARASVASVTWTGG